MSAEFPELINAFLRAACVPRDAWHAQGTIDRANAMLEDHPELSAASIHTAAVLGDAEQVRHFLASDASLATSRGGPYGWDALTHLCFSNYLKFDEACSAGFAAAATALLDAGADVNTGWLEAEHEPRPEWECALYGAAGVAHHPELTALLVARGADVNDGEVVYHTPETYDNRALQVLLDSGQLTMQSLTFMLIRKHDWHDLAGARMLLAAGADPNASGPMGLVPMFHALARDNALELFELLLDHGADPTLTARGHSGFAAAARTGRSDVLQLLERRGFTPEFVGADRLVAAAARGDGRQARELVAREPGLVAELHQLGGDLLSHFARSNNAAGIEQLLDLGVDVAAPFTSGDGYFGTPKGSLAIHFGAWRGGPEVVRLLLERGSPADLPDPNGRTPLMLAVRAAVDSYWTERRTTGSIEALLAAGADASRVSLPTGYPEADLLLGERQ
ncbi:MAG: ankryin [Gemmatimonadales bacterium]